MTETVRSRAQTWCIAALVLALLAGVFLRLPQSLFSGEQASLAALQSLHPPPKFSNVGFDEGLYRQYVNSVALVGLGS